ncbi:hypothetical protein LR48_Vigan10g163500 [Vigna angularis]|uniref:Uncharacterized protein n=1 Tax=Phaseolus angularis TaxID=3914 RepID=A0A0L9VL93_PHAAN|nr:hypothetical protein LR48_Vigan10g163500 [Vigna angularis]
MPWEHHVDMWEELQNANEFVKSARHGAGWMESRCGKVKGEDESSGLVQRKERPEPTTCEWRVMSLEQHHQCPESCNVIEEEQPPLAKRRQRLKEEHNGRSSSWSSSNTITHTEEKLSDSCNSTTSTSSYLRVPQQRKTSSFEQPQTRSDGSRMNGERSPQLGMGAMKTIFVKEECSRQSGKQDDKRCKMKGPSPYLLTGSNFWAINPAACREATH